MTKLVELELGDGRTVLMESNDQASVPRSALSYRRAARDADVRASFDGLAETLRTFTDRSVQALRDVDAGVERVTLQFGVSLGGEAGIPYVVKGRDDATLFVTVECDLSRRGKRLSLDGD